MWIDRNKDGHSDIESEPFSSGTFANLRQCDGKWVQTTRSNDQGYYEFVNMTEGEYYLEFFLPSYECEFC
jgi:serine-aspartate repeat-containing protein C/D/E